MTFIFGSNGKRHWTSRKAVAFGLTLVVLALGAVVIRNGNYAAMATAAVGLYGAFATTNTIAGAVGQSPPAPPTEGQP